LPHKQQPRKSKPVQPSWQQKLLPELKQPGSNEPSSKH
jgi:hypothetical protein